MLHHGVGRLVEQTQYELLELVVPFLVCRHVNVIADGPQKGLSSHLGETVGEGWKSRYLIQHVCAVAARYLANASLRVDSKVHRKVLSNQTLQRLPDTETEQLSRESKLVEELRFTKVNIEVGLVVQSSHVEVLRCEVLNIIDLRVANNILLRQANEEMVVVAVAAP
ncbi:asparagine synthase, putative [Babesia ovata]|uniref:Asparagine synthase, putative n=1 Tax=Babesia ovata TaxID=189622 RepID=A0A2H6KBQ0_9APIC|nr:asparagine synthase, putative [Babesia ovata]XP_028866638.1 asparagine synthase, putative [Babesia ovata]GBE60389.1 asparagine synthase, putative [Babesia ovata]GBE60395.1 asparagine synthase, putative [Babesia ovata]